MAIILNSNPLPRTGALYVSNPRRKNKRKSIPRRDNGGMNRWVYGQVLGGGKTPNRLTQEQKKKIVEIRMGRAGSTAQQKKAQKAMKDYKSGSGAAGTFKKRQKAAKRAFAKSIKTGSINRKSSSRRKSSTKKTATGSKKRQKVQTAFSKMSKSKQSKLKRHAKAGKWNLFVAEFGGDFSKASSLYKRLKKGTVSNPKRRKNSSVKSKGRKIKYTTFSKRLAGCGLSAKQRSALWSKYKSTGKLPALAKSKASSAKRTASRKTSGRKTLTAWQKFIKKHKGSGKTLKQLSRLYKKQHSHKHSHGKKKSHKHAHSHRPKSSTRHSHKHKGSKSSGRKISAWQKFLKKFGGRGLTKIQLQRLYKKPKAQQDLVAQRLKKQRVRKGESKSAARKRYQQRARGMVRQRGKYQPMMGPYLMRLNPARTLKGSLDDLIALKPFSAALGVANTVQGYVEKVPVIGMAAPYIAPLSLGAVAAISSFYAGKYIGPEIQKLTAGTVLQGADRYGYFLSGSALALGLAGAHRYLNLFDSRAIQLVGGIAIVGGAFVDMLDWKLKGNSFLSFFGLGKLLPSAKAGIHLNGIHKGAIHKGAAHYGDGGLYYLQGVGRGNSPLSGARSLQRSVPTPASSYSGIAQSLSGASNASGAPMGYGALMYTGAGY